ncbi:MAG: hypothetical protein RL350_1155 [Pseudomonadota bacterium]
MTRVFAIGDVQGCLRPLNQLIKKLPQGSKLIFLGDLVNRGPDSLGALRRLKQLQEDGVAECLLGNHDLNLLACDAGLRDTKPLDTIDDILAAPDRRELIDWLRHRPMALSNGKVLLVHAGVLPQWSLKRTLSLAHEVETALRHKKYRDFLAQMYFLSPDVWQYSQLLGSRINWIRSFTFNHQYPNPHSVLHPRGRNGV